MGALYTFLGLAVALLHGIKSNDFPSLFKKKILNHKRRRQKTPINLKDHLLLVEESF